VTISIIAAMAANRIIGKDGKIPWHISEDLKRFKKLTTGHTVIMGRKTHESIGKPLPERRNIILTRNHAYTAPGCLVAHTLREAISLSISEKDIFFIGGGEVYLAALPRTGRVYLTVLHAAFEGDTFFPILSVAAWRMTEEEVCTADVRGCCYSFRIYERIAERSIE
jgi:dihydrofolate reductase